MQRYSKISKTMFTERYLMFKMHQLTEIRPKITDFKHFQPKITTFSLKNAHFSWKLAIFAHLNFGHKWIIAYY